MTTPGEPVLVIQLSDVYGQLVQQNAQLAVITDRLNQLPDHEARIRALERWRYGIPLTGAGAVGGIVLAIVNLLLHKG